MSDLVKIWCGFFSREYLQDKRVRADSTLRGSTKATYIPYQQLCNITGQDECKENRP